MKHNQPIEGNQQLAGSNDKHIDQDFPGYPHHPSKENTINPKSEKDKKAANADKSGSDQPDRSKHRYRESSDQDNGSAGAFEATENPRE